MGDSNELDEVEVLKQFAPCANFLQPILPSTNTVPSLSPSDPKSCYNYACSHWFRKLIFPLTGPQLFSFPK